MTDFDWDEYANTGDWITFAQVGDSAVGTVKAVRRGKDFNGNPCPELVIETTDGEKTLTAGQVMLKSALAVAQPQVGDKIAIVYSGIGDAKPGKAPAKLFEVSVQKPGAPSGVSADDLLAG
jgi:hypothetical protein